MSEETDPSPLRSFIAVFVGSGGTALCVSFASWSYSAAMAGDMIFAAVLVFLSWLVGSTALIVTNQYRFLRFADDYQTKAKIIFILFLFLFCLYGWEWQHRQTPAPTSQEIADAVIASLPPLPPESQRKIFKSQEMSGQLFADHPEDLRDYKIRPSSSLEIGDSGALFTFSNEAGGTLFDIFNKSDLRVEMLDGKVLVSTKILGRLGQIVAEIIRNEWRSAPYPATWDFNYSNNAFEVKGSSGDVVLQVRVLLDRVQIQGKWYDQGGKAFALVSYGYQKGAAILFGDINVTAGTIDPIFKYPSSLHLGELVR